MPVILQPYRRGSAVAYAHRWAYRRNPLFYDYENIGGDCTNFVSQCLLAGGAVMNFTPELGWYYIDANNKSPSWTGVEFQYAFLTRETISAGPVAVLAQLQDMMAGDIIQLSFDGLRFTHSVLVVASDRPQRPQQILIASHSSNSDLRPLSTYDFLGARFLHVAGIFEFEGREVPI